MKRPKTIVVTSNKGGSGKTPITINIAAWGLSQDPPLKVLAIDINHTNQDLFQAMRHLRFTDERKYETTFSLEGVGTAHYIPLSDTLHLVRPQIFKPLTSEQMLRIVTESASAFADEQESTPFEPDLIVVDSNYCFPIFRVDVDMKLDLDPLTFMNVWSITSPHELRLPKEYRMTINSFKTLYNDPDWDKKHFIHVFSILEKDRTLTSEMMKMISRRRGIYTVPGSDDLADLYRKIAEDEKVDSEGYSFDHIQLKVFSPILAEIDSLVMESPWDYSEDILNARWIERINIFLTQTKKFPLNVLPLPHYYPFLRKSVVDIILRERVDLELVRLLFSDFYKWMDMYLTRFFNEP